MKKLIPEIKFSILDFISQSANDAHEQLDKFYNFASMQMFA